MKLCDLDLSRELQELGYDGEYQCLHVNASEDGYETLTVAECREYESDIDNRCPAPRLDDAAYWLREKHGIHVFLTYIPCSGWWTPYVADMHGNYNSFLAYPKGGGDYEEVYESGEGCSGCNQGEEGMNIGLMAVDSRRFNFALAKIATYHKAKGDNVEWYDPMFGQYDRLYMSKIFNFTPDYRGVISNAREIVRGGTGYSLTATLPEEIEHCLPDYSLYPEVDGRTSYGFLTRGCPNRCKWCVVPRKEGDVRPYADIDDVTENGKRPYAVLMDNNILASEYGLKQIRKIIGRGYHVDFNQALDARLVTPEVAKMLSQVKWIDSLVRFGCDTPRQIDECERAMRLMAGYGYRGQWLMYTMINADFGESVSRLSHFRGNRKVRIVAQPFRDPDGRNEIPQWQRDLAHWATRHELYASCDFADYSPRKGFTCNEYFKTIKP